jgi:hypothetical protein
MASSPSATPSSNAWPNIPDLGLACLKGEIVSVIKDKIGFYKNKFRHRNLDNFYFIHINKTGGSSIENALKIPFEHKTAREKIAEVGLDKWRRRFTFAIVRNPWDKVVSHYCYRVKTNQTGLSASSMSFSDWVERAYWYKDPAFRDKEKMFMPQVEWVRSTEGGFLVDYVGYFEDLEGSFDEAMKRTGLTASLPHLKSTKRRDYRDYYDASSRQIVAESFADDIEAFNYSF